jgi:trigger factor
LRVEIPTEVVDAEIERIARDYSKKARIPGFRPGKAPARVIKQRFKDQILHDVAHDLIPRAVDDALRERGVEAVDTPDVRDVNIEEGRPRTFTASFDTVPAFDPGDLSTISLHRAKVGIDEEAVNGALQRLRDAVRASSQSRDGVDHGDGRPDLDRKEAGGESDRHTDVSIEMGAKANPPGSTSSARPGGRRDEDLQHPLSAGLPSWGARQHRGWLYSDGEEPETPGAAGTGR